MNFTFRNSELPIFTFVAEDGVPKILAKFVVSLEPTANWFIESHGQTFQNAKTC